MTGEKDASGLLASVAKLFRPGVDETPAEPPSCCGECGGQAKARQAGSNNDKAPAGAREEKR